MRRSTDIYSASRNEILERFAAHLEGSPSGVVCIVSSTTLDDVSRAALQKSFTALGYGATPCTFVTQEKIPDARLSSSVLFKVLEGLDPLVLVATDAQAVKVCSEAYREAFPLMKRCRIFGREARGFASFEQMMDDAQGKQRAWALLKTLPRP